MSDFKINSIATKQGQHGPVIAGVSTINSTGCMKIPSGPTEFRGGRTRGVVAGSTPSQTNTMQFITITTAGNATDFGDLTVTRRDPGGLGSSVRGVFPVGGYPSQFTVIDFTTFSSGGGANDFGDARISAFQPSGASNNVRGIFAGGVKSSPTRGQSNIDFITIASTGDSNEFGNLSSVRWGAGGVNSPTRAIFAAGAGTPTYLKAIEFVTIATLGDSQDFGEVSTAVRNLYSACSSTRGVFAGAQTSSSSPYSYVNTIEFITIATLGNTSDFGDMTQARSRGAGVSNSIRGVFLGGIVPGSPSTYTNRIDFVTIASTGNATDFGDLLAAIGSMGGASDSHGGIGL